ncbi:MAG: putative 2OG-Fe(II) oxygenase [Gammaproteobacteria bacterium]
MPVFQKITSTIASHTNADILKQFLAQQNNDNVRKTHFFEDRYENIYLNEQHIPQLKPLIREALSLAEKILDKQNLRAGYWFNYMPPGATTTLHTHDDDDELLSAVYYVYVPENSGNLIIYDDSKSDNREKVEITSSTGDFIFFKPDIRHEVSKNNSTESRLSIGINFGQRKT